MTHQCEDSDIQWDDRPDYEGAMGMCIRWFGTCEACNRRVFYLWEPQGLRDCETREYPEEVEIEDIDNGVTR